MSQIKVRLKQGIHILDKEVIVFEIKDDSHVSENTYNKKKSL